jgi:hypothetical protein
MSGLTERDGRRRRASSFAGPFANAAAIAIAIIPRLAAARSSWFPKTARAAAIKIHSRE